MTARHDIQFAVEDVELKIASKALLKGYGTGDALEALFGRRQQHWSDCGNRNVDEWLTLLQVAHLEDRTAGQPSFPSVTRQLAARQGFALVPLPQPLPSDGDLLMVGAKVAKEAGDVSGAICAALGDMKVCPRDADDIDHQADELIAMAMRLKALVRAIKAGER